MAAPGAGEGDAAALRALAELGRAAVRRLWARRDERESLTETERRLLAILEDHREYRPFWEGADPDSEENPFLHVHLHELVETQLERGEPPEVGEALARLLGRGLDRHEAIHRILQALVEHAGESFRTGKADPAAYAARLRRL